MPAVEDILRTFKRMSAGPEDLAGMARFGIATHKRFGVSIPNLRRLAKETGQDHKLALALWKTGYGDARILASMIDDPAQTTEKQMDAWVKDFDSWDVCDQVCMNLFEKTPFAWERITAWAEREEEFVRRAAFALLACVAWHDKAARDGRFIALFPLIVSHAADERNYVKKALNWALRNIGKRNLKLNQAAIGLAEKLRKRDSKSARWIASDALRELQSEAVQQRIRK